MASAFLRSSTLRQFCYSFNSRFLSSRFHSLPEKSLQNSPLASNHYELLRAFSANNRFLCTNAPNPGASQSNVNAAAQPGVSSAQSGSEKRNDGGQNSGGSENTQQQGKSVRGGPVSWMSFFLLFCTGVGLVYYYDREKRRHIEGLNKASSAVKQGPSVGKAAIGGPFNLVDHNGKTVSEKDFLGKWNLFYFGFTHCPDICPDELQKLASAIDKIKAKSGLEVVPVFISVDPERDTVEQVREYVKEFHPKLIGLTGSPDDVKKTARAYRVYYMKTEEEGSDYLVDHSIVMYLMDPDMQFVKFFGKNLDDASLADGVIREIKQHKKVKA
ncbi:protein SCO1 homolog 1, mitochondrial [Salvia miltiorrhiza]|uniref:protein SCO1 homolog 1, mitochondrial n=1 Tax=Salvia miltiorrhiza TaxID=226208 RepID=UPI0025ABC8C3|nr:protein SCO1 homolog 1, mitochondrial [Salvia miltiorrhiza]